MARKKGISARNKPEVIRLPKKPISTNKLSNEAIIRQYKLMGSIRDYDLEGPEESAAGLLRGKKRSIMSQRSQEMTSRYNQFRRTQERQLEQRIINRKRTK